MPPFPPNAAPPVQATNNAYGMPPQNSNPQPQASLAGLAPNLLALLQQQAAQQRPQQQQQPPPMPYGMPPPQQMMPPNPAASSMGQMPPSSQPSYQQLMAYLVSTSKRFAHAH